MFAIRGADRLVVGAVVGRMPQGMMSLAALLLVNSKYHSFAIAGLAVGAVAIGIALAAPVFGSLVDRHGARRMLAPIAAGQAVVSTAFALSAVARVAPAALVPLGILTGMLVPPISATMRSAWMKVIDDAQTRDAAFALDAMATQLVFALGPLLAAAIVAIAGPAPAVVASGLITLVGTLVFASAEPVGAVVPHAARHPRPGVAARRRLRWTPALSSKPMRTVLLGVLVAGFAGGSIEVGLPAVAVHLHARAISGVLVGLWALGAAVGGWYYGRRRLRAALRARLRVAAAGVAILSLPLMAATSLPAALTLSFVAGLPWSPLYASQYALVGEAAPMHALTESFTWNVAAIVGGVAVGNAVGGVIAASVGSSGCFAAAALAMLAIVAVSWARATASPRPPSMPEQRRPA